MTTSTRTPGSPTPAAVRAARVKLGFTQTQAAAIIGYSKRGWQEWEYGVCIMHPTIWWALRVKLAIANGATLEEIKRLDKGADAGSIP